MTPTNEQISIAEGKALIKAARYAYETTNHIEDADVQRLTYRLVYESTCMGIRMMQEELKNTKTSKKTE